MSMDARYLATVVLTFVVLHEHAHIAHRHNSLEPMAEDPQIKQIVEGVMRFAKDHPDTVAVDLTESTQRFEQDADCFAIEAVPETYRSAMLEAATLWFTTLASADRGGTDWLEKSAEGKGRAYPQYAMRVWFLNGRYSTGMRQGKIAQEITRTAQAIEASPSSVDLSLENLSPGVSRTVEDRMCRSGPRGRPRRGALNLPLHLREGAGGGGCLSRMRLGGVTSRCRRVPGT